MPILGHFSRYAGPELRMPRNEGVDPATGIEYEGKVLRGELSPEEAIRSEAHEAVNHGSRRIPVSARACDPVLRFHLRLDSVELPNEPNSKNGHPAPIQDGTGT